MHWLREPQPISNQLVGWGFYTARGGIAPTNLCFRPRVVGVLEILRYISDPGIKHYPPRVQQELDVGQRGSSGRALGP